MIASTGLEGDLTKEQLKERTEAVMADPDKSSFALGMAETVSTRAERHAGYRVPS